MQQLIENTPKYSVKSYMEFLKRKLQTCNNDEKKAIKKELKKYKKLFKSVDNN